MNGILDSHVHFWDRDRFNYTWLDEGPPELRPNFLPADLLSETDAIDGVVAVQADCRDDQVLAEAAWFHELAAAGAPVYAVVAQAPLETDCLDHLMALSDLPLVSGVRRLIQGEPMGFALDENFVSGVQLLAKFSFSMDLCIRHEQLAEALTLVRVCPEIRFVLDHFGKPEPVPSAFDNWARGLEALAAEPNVSAKLSGLATEAPEGRRSFAALQPWLAHALDVFGPERCMFGSDWPVVKLAMPYAEWVELVQQAVPEADRAMVFGVTAREFYAPGR